MATDLREVAAELLLAPASTLGLELIGSQGKPSTYQSVDLAHGALRVRVQRERATVEVLFGAGAAPFEWFDSSEVIQYFTGTRSSVTGTDPQKSVTMLREFLASEIGVLMDAFSLETFESTRAALLQLRRIVNEQLAPGYHSRADSDPGAVVRDDVMETLTPDEAYRAMFSFLDEVYQRTHSDELAVLLGSMSMLDDGRPADPAMWHVWEQAISRARADRNVDRLRFER